MYKLTSSDIILRQDDGAAIPSDPDNIDYVNYLAWLAAGNTPIPANVPDPNIAIQAQIDVLESDSLLSSGAREMLIWQLENRAETVAEKTGAVAADLLASDIYYQKLKALDAKIAALRSALV